jgi:hypothetical protein
MKTSSMIAAFPDALFIGDTARLPETAAAELGINPYVWPLTDDEFNDLGMAPPADESMLAPVRDLEHLLDLLDYLVSEAEELREAGEELPFTAICCDDISLICRTSIAAWEDQEVKTKSGEIDGFYQYKQLTKYMVRIPPQMRMLNRHFWCTAHEIEPVTAGKFPSKGGADFGSKGQINRVTAWISTSIRAVTNKDWPDPWGGIASGKARWKDPWWVYNDSRGMFGEQGDPLNIREAARASRMPTILPRCYGLEWQDQVADEVVSAIGAAVPTTDQVQAIYDDLLANASSTHAKSKKYIEAFDDDSDLDLHVRWAVQDGIARWHFKMKRARSLAETTPSAGNKRRRRSSS